MITKDKNKKISIFWCESYRFTTRNPFPPKYKYFVVQQFFRCESYRFTSKNTLLQKRHVFIVRNFSTPNHGLELKSTLKTKTLVLVFKQFFGYPPPRRGHPRNTLLQKRAVFIVRNFLDAFPKGGGSLLPNNFVFGQHKNI